MSKQIKSKKRVNDFGEVYTADSEVNAMLELVSEQAASITATFLEPACGNGNFVSAILSRKLSTVEQQHTDAGNTELNILRAIASIYGVDIQNDNVLETRSRLRKQALEQYEQLSGRLGHTKTVWLRMLDTILEANVICGNTLTAKTSDDTDLKFSEWTITNRNNILRDETRYCDMLSGADEKPENHILYRYSMLHGEALAA